jgi:hypothetical protein
MNLRLLSFARLSLVVLSCLYASLASAQTPAPAPIYSDALADGWENWSWDTQANFSAASPVKTGAHSTKVTYTGGWGGLYLHNPGVSLSGYTHLQFWIHGGTAGDQSLQIYAEDSSGRAPAPLALNSYV